MTSRSSQLAPNVPEQCSLVVGAAAAAGTCRRPLSHSARLTCIRQAPAPRSAPVAAEAEARADALLVRLFDAPLMCGCVSPSFRGQGIERCSVCQTRCSKVQSAFARGLCRGGGGFTLADAVLAAAAKPLPPLSTVLRRGAGAEPRAHNRRPRALQGRYPSAASSYDFVRLTDEQFQA